MLLVDAGVCIFWALLILVLPLPWLGAAFLAAAMHELCHLAAIYLVRGRVTGFRLGMGGAVMDAFLPGISAELVCAMAGPAGSLALAFFWRMLPRTAVCALVQGLYNLLPLYPLDGGRIFRCILLLICPEKAERILLGTERFLRGAILMGAFLCLFLPDMGIFPAATASLLLLKRKSPCKEGQIRVQ